MLRKYRPVLILLLLLASVLPFGLAEPPPPVQGVGPLTLPAGFVDELTVGGLLGPRAFVFTPDGRILIAERGSAASSDINVASIRVFKNGSLLPTRAITFGVCGDGERGFLGMALDPSFATNGYLYVYYTAKGPNSPVCGYNTYNNNQPGPRNRVVRFTMVGDTIDPATARTLIDNIATDSGIHNSGDLHFGADGYLYITTGDSNLSPSPAQFTDNLMGKVLRILPTPGNAGGYTTPGNPFNNAANSWFCGANPPHTSAGPCKEIFAYGFRNPFRFTIQPGTSNVFLGDVGGGAWEEIDKVIAGGNYGYPSREGPCSAGVNCTPPQPPSGYEEPIAYYPHTVLYANTDSAVIGGAFYTSPNYPAEYQNNFFFADFVQGWIKRLIYNSGAGSWEVQPFAANGSSIIGIRTGLDGDLYYLSIPSNSQPACEIRHIRYEAGVNQPPAAQISVNPTNGPLDTAYQFSASGSGDPDDNLPLIYNWDFGDGTTLSSSTTASPTHTYSTPGTKTVTLTVTDSGSPPATSAPVTVNVYPANAAPTGQITLTNMTAPGRTHFYHAGDTWRFEVINPGDDQPLPPNAFSWDVVFHHSDHTHPFLSGVNGSEGNFTIPPLGEPSPNVWYRVRLYITDSQGQTTTVERDVTPATVNLTLTTNPAGGMVGFEGGAYPAPHTATRVVGMNLSISAPSPQVVGGVDYGFASWSIGGNQTQTIVVPAANTTYTIKLSLFPPSPNFPSNNAAPLQRRPLFDWSNVNGATSYTLQIATDQAFAKLLVNLNLTPSAYQMTSDLPANTLVFWRVRANGAYGAGTWSRVRHFTTPNPPNTPGLVAPADAATVTGLTPTLDWSDSSPGLAYYEVQIASTANFTGITRGRQQRVSASAFTLETPLAANTLYYWRVRAVNAQGEFSPWSSVRTFSTPP